MLFSQFTRPVECTHFRMDSAHVCNNLTSKGADYCTVYTLYRTVYYSYTVHMHSLIRARTYSPFISSVLNDLLAISTFILYIIFNRLTSCSRRAVGGDVGEHHKDRLRARGGGGAQAAARRDGARVHLRGRMSARAGHHPSRFPLFSLPSPLLSALSSSFRHLNFRAHPLSIPITADSC